MRLQTEIQHIENISPNILKTLNLFYKTKCLAFKNLKTLNEIFSTTSLSRPICSCK